MTGSTRSVALMRIGLALLGWAEFGNPVQPHRAPHAGLSIAYYLATTASLFGIRARESTFLAGAVYLASITMVQARDMREAYPLAVASMVLAFTPCGTSLSVDRWRTTPAPLEEGNLWGLHLVRAVLSGYLAYGGYGLMKTGTHWFVATNPDGHPEFMAGLLELAAAAVLWLPRHRLYAAVAVLSITTTLALLFNLRAAAALADVLLLAFLPPELVHETFDTLLGRGPNPLDPPEA